MLEHLINFFVSGFANPSYIGIGLAVVFGAVWLAPHWPPLFKKPWLWAVLVSSAVLAWAAVAFIQIPFQALVGQVLGNFFSEEVLMGWLLLAGIPQILLSGLVQEGAKLIPMVVWWWRNDMDINPKLGLAIGAVAGAGLGIFEAQWALNNIFASGWTWDFVQAGGVMMLAGFWERFFAVAFHIAVSALAGYGLARGWGWQFYLIASFLHGFLNYSAVLLKSEVLNPFQLEIFVAVVAVLVTAWALWLRWRKPKDLIEVEEGEIK